MLNGRRAQKKEEPLEKKCPETTKRKKTAPHRNGPGIGTPADVKIEIEQMIKGLDQE
jgi:hypothetical protein